jgi:hypothetical protein
MPLAGQNACSVKGLRRCVLESLLDRGDGVLDELAPRHLGLNIGYMEISVEKHDRVADGVDDVYHQLVKHLKELV